jgi:NAD-dependent SIR2 family protein deacetylase
MPIDKLYVKIKCTVCEGTKKYNSGFHDPLSPFKWKECPYCDRDALYLIEASKKTIVEYLKQLPEQDRQQLLRELKD